MSSRATSAGPPRVLVLRALGLGDLVTAVPALRALRRAFPGHRVELATLPSLAPLALSSGAVDAVVPAVPLARLPSGTGGAAVAVNLHGAGPQSHRLLLARRPGRLVAFAHPDVPASAGGPEHDPAEHERRRWCRLLAAHGIPADPDDLLLDPPDGVSAAETTVIHPGAASGARRWPVERWAQVAAAERASGRRVVLTGSGAERRLCERLAALACLPSDDVAAGRTDVVALCRLVAAAGLVLSGDTGVAHLAHAFARPSVTLYGPVSPSRWGPPADPRHRALWHGAEGDPHGGTLDPSLARIVVEEVVEAIGVARRVAQISSATTRRSVTSSS